MNALPQVLIAVALFGTIAWGLALLAWSFTRASRPPQPVNKARLPGTYYALWADDPDGSIACATAVNASWPYGDDLTAHEAQDVAERMKRRGDWHRL
jgi:hypothetical protein